MAQRRLRDDELKTIADEVGASIDPKDPRNVFFSGNEEAFRKKVQDVAGRPPVPLETPTTLDTPKQSFMASGLDSAGRMARSAAVGAANLIKSSPRTMADLGVGAGAGLANTVFSGGDLSRRATGMNRIIDEPDVKALMTPPNSPAGRLGYGVEQVGEFFIPGKAGLSGVKLASKLPQAATVTTRLARALFGSSVEGIGAAGVTALQGGGAKDAAATGLLTGAMTAAAGPVVRVAGKFPQWLGERIEKSLLKPTTFTSEGLTPTQIVKKVYQYGVGGNLQTSLEKITQKIDTLRGQLKGVLTHSSQEGAGVSLNRVARDTLEEFTGNLDAQASIGRISKEIEFHLNSQGKPMLSGVMDLLDANTAKQAVGDVGSWTHGLSGQVISDADRHLEKVANKYYYNLKTAIENMAQGPAKSINEALGDLIMLRGVLMRRIPAAERANVLNMGDLLAVSSHTFGLSMLNRLLQSGTVANALKSSGAAIDRSAPRISSSIGRMAGAVPSVLSRPNPVPAGERITVTGLDVGN